MTSQIAQGTFFGIFLSGVRGSHVEAKARFFKKQRQSLLRVSVAITVRIIFVPPGCIILSFRILWPIYFVKSCSFTQNPLHLVFISYVRDPVADMRYKIISETRLIRKFRSEIHPI